jgi:glycosyltransferase involved in cell wall biosynthesis
MSVYNGARYLQESVDSILGQTYRDFEFLIVDDASSDGSPAMLRDAASSDRRVRVIQNEKNIGLTRSLNRAIREARGDIIARHDADDIAMPTRFETQLRLLEGSCDVVGTNYVVIGEGGEFVEGLPSHYADDARRALARGKNPLCHSSVMFRRVVIDEAGSYDERWRYAQDYELWLRLNTLGYVICNIPAPLQRLRRYGGEIAATQRRAQLTCIVRIQVKYLRHYWRNLHYVGSICIEIARLALPGSTRGLVSRLNPSSKRRARQDRPG